MSRILFACPVGGDPSHVLACLTVFHAPNIDWLLLDYRGVSRRWPRRATVIGAKGGKWSLAARFMRPAQLAKYDFIFYWDDDIRPVDVDPVVITEAMKRNRLDMAQPAVTSRFRIAHGITRRHVNPPMANGRPVIGRATTFVETMVPVFSREGWRRFHGFLSPDIKVGWGLDLIRWGRKGVIDRQLVEHTRPVRSNKHPDALREMDAILRKHGNGRRWPLETTGWLLG